MAQQQIDPVGVSTDRDELNTDMEFARIVDQHIRASYQGLAVSTTEESRLETTLNYVGKKSGLPMVIWDIAQGFTGNCPKDAKDRKYMSPHEALKAVTDKTDKSPFHNSSGKENNYLFVFRDLDDFFQDPVVRRLIRTMCEGNQLVYNLWKRPLVITSSRLQLHDKIKPYLTVLEFALPDEARLQAVFDFVRRSIVGKGNDEKAKAKAACAPELEEQIVTAMKGLTTGEAENALSHSLVLHAGFKPQMVSTLKDEKAAIIKKSEVLTYIPETQMVTRDQIGGFEHLLDFIDRRRLAYSKDARAKHIDLPKGVVLLGLPGTGKSMVATAVARLLGLPGYIMDIGSVFGSLVGESEARMRAALKQIEAQQGCVLVLDEADKALGGSLEGNGDSGVTRRIFGQLLSWLANKQDRTFVIMTLNRTKGIPPEFLRAGRFDAVFFTDLPQPHEREQILKIHLAKRNVDVPALGLGPDDWAELVTKTEDFVGSEIEEVVREARYLSYQERSVGEPNLEEFMRAASSIVPLAKLDKEAIDEIRNFCKDRCRPASVFRTQREKAEKPTARSRAVNLGDN